MASGTNGPDNPLLTENGDLYVGLGGADTINGLGGVDTLRGGDGDDVIDGGAGNDQIQGNAGDDSIHGGDNDDFIQGDAGADTLFGDAGNDTIIIDQFDSLLPSALNGGDGTDTVSGLSATAAIVGLNMHDTFFEVFGGTAFGDVVSGNESSTVALRLAGADGNDTLTGGGGNDNLQGMNGDDSLVGGSGNDTMIGGAGTDRFDGGAGNDSFLDVDVSEISFVNGGDGVDTMTVSTGTVNLTNVGNLKIEIFNISGGGDDTLVAGVNVTTGVTINGFGGNDSLVGGNFNDIMNGGDGNDRLNGGLGDDVVAGGTGNDNIQGIAGNDRLYGNDGADSLSGGANNDTLAGGNDGDSLLGDDGNDALHGEAGSDTLQGGNGNDTLVGGADVSTIGLTGAISGNDLVVGGAGDDVFYYQSLADGNDRLTDFSQAVGNNDAFQFDKSVFNVVSGWAGAVNIVDADQSSDDVSAADVIRYTGALANPLNMNSIAEVDAFTAAGNADTGGVFVIAHHRMASFSSLALYYDANGSQAGGVMLVAAFANDATTGNNTNYLTAADFIGI